MDYLPAPYEAAVLTHRRSGDILDGVVRGGGV
jgi:hypothetical protein